MYRHNEEVFCSTTYGYSFSLIVPPMFLRFYQESDVGNHHMTTSLDKIIAIKICSSNCAMLNPFRYDLLILKGFLYLVDMIFAGIGFYR